MGSHVEYAKRATNNAVPGGGFLHNTPRATSENTFWPEPESDDQSAGILLAGQQQQQQQQQQHPLWLQMHRSEVPIPVIHPIGQGISQADTDAGIIGVINATHSQRLLQINALSQVFKHHPRTAGHSLTAA